MSQCNKVTYIADVACKAEFESLANIFVAQLYNLLSLRANRLNVVQSIIYKPELKKTQRFLYKNQIMHLYIAKYARDFINKEMLSIKNF